MLPLLSQAAFNKQFYISPFFVFFLAAILHLYAIYICF